MPNERVVIVINTNPDLVRLIAINLEAAGFVVFVMHIAEIKQGAVDVEALLREHDPKVVVYDVAPPFEQNWRFLDHLRQSPSFKGRRFVLTTVNARWLDRLVGREESVYEVVGQEEDMAQVVRAVKEASRARDVR